MFYQILRNKFSYIILIFPVSRNEKKMKIMLFILYNLIPKPEILTHFYKENGKKKKILTALSSEIINVHKTETFISKEMDTLPMLSHFSCVWLFVTPWTVACQAPLSMGFSRHEYWSGLLLPSSEDLPDLGSHPCLLGLLHRRAGSLLLVPPGKALDTL